MSSNLLDTYRTNWPRVGAVLGMAVFGGASTLIAGRRLDKLRALSVMNFIALLAHEYEEYVEPGYFPGQFNRVIFKSDQPRNYPMNTNTAMLVNTTAFYPFYIAPIIFPKVKWLGLPPVVLGIFQSIAHGVMLPRMAHTRYSTGSLTATLLHVPIGFSYIRALRARGVIGRAVWVKSAIVTLIFVILGVAAPQVLGRDRNSPHAFTAKQMGAYDTGSTLVADD